MYWVQVILIVTVLLFQHQSHLCLLEADGGVAHGGLEEDEGVTVDEDGGLPACSVGWWLMAGAGLF
jgi:hypothetical protein